MTTRVELFEIYVPLHDTYRYTSAQIDIYHDGDLWFAESIGRGASKMSADNSNSPTVRIELGIQNEVVRIFDRYPPAQDVRATIYEGSVDDNGEMITSSVEQVFTGAMSSTGSEDGIAVFEISPWLHQSDRSGPRGTFTAGCRWSLYGPGCRLDESDWGYLFEVVETDIDDSVISLVSIDNIDVGPGSDWPHRIGIFTGGFLRVADDTHMNNPEGDRVLVIDHFDNEPDPTDTFLFWRMRIATWTEDLANASHVRAYPGCRKTRQDCIERYDNVDNYGGFYGLENVEKSPFFTGFED